jgi:predicted PurR-regulated permease PerM
LPSVQLFLPRRFFSHDAGKEGRRVSGTEWYPKIVPIGGTECKPRRARLLLSVRWPAVEAGPWYTPSHDESFDRRVIRTVVTVIAAVFSIYLIFLLRTPLLWLVVSLFVAIALSGPVNLLARHMPRGGAIGVVYAAILLIPIALGTLLIPPIVTSAVDLVDDLPAYIDDFQKTVEEDNRFIRLDENFDIKGQLQEIQTNLADRLGSAASVLGSIGEWVINSMFAALTIFILSIFMVARGRSWVEALIRRRPAVEAAALDRGFERIGVSVSRYIGGAMLQAFIAGLFAFVVLSILGVSSPLVLAVIVAVFDVIPMVGSTIAGLLVGIVTFFASFPVDTIIWAIFVIGYQQFENYVIQPRIQSEAVNLDPFVVLIAVLFGGTLMGVVGAILAIPIAATILIAVQEWSNFKVEIAGASEAALQSSDAGSGGGSSGIGTSGNGDSP